LKDNNIYQLRSPDDEIFDLNTHRVNIVNRAFTDWIKSVENSMQQSVLEQSIQIFNIIKDQSFDVNYIIEIIEKNALQPYILAILGKITLEIERRLTDSSNMQLLYGNVDK